QCSPPPSEPANRAFFLSLDHIGIDFDAPVVKEAREAVPTGECVPDCLGELCLLTDQRELGPQPWFEIVENGPAFGLANGAALVSAEPPDVLLDGVETSNTVECLTGNRRWA